MVPIRRKRKGLWRSVTLICVVGLLLLSAFTMVATLVKHGKGSESAGSLSSIREEILSRAWSHRSPVIASDWPLSNTWSKPTQSSNNKGTSNSLTREVALPMVVDALGRPIAATTHSQAWLTNDAASAIGKAAAGKTGDSHSSRIHSSNGAAVGSNSGGGPQSTNSANQPVGKGQSTSQAVSAASQFEEAECLALVRDSHPNAPAEPTALEACKPVLARMAERLLNPSLSSSSSLMPLHQSSSSSSSSFDSSYTTSSSSSSDGSSNSEYLDPSPFERGGSGRPMDQPSSSSSSEGSSSLDFTKSHPASETEARRTVTSPPVTVATLRNEAQRCGVTGGHNSPPVLMWRAKRGRMASKACKVSSWRGSGAKHAIANASVSHWPFVCRPHESGHAWGGLQHLFGGRSFREVVVVREPLARAVAVYYWLGRRPASLRKLVGIKDAVTNLLQPPPVVKATHYAKNLPEAYTGPGASDLPRWPWHSFAWGAAEAVAMLEDRQMAVVVLEHYDESLLALRRLMKWPMAEVLYTVKRRAEGLSHASWESWPPAAIRALKASLKKHGAVEFHTGALKRWATMIGQLYPEGRETFTAELTLLKYATSFLSDRCSNDPDLLETYISHLIERSKLTSAPPSKGGGLEYAPPKANIATRPRRAEGDATNSADKGAPKHGRPGDAEDSSFSFLKAPLSLHELCVRHQYCEHVRGKAHKLLGSASGSASPDNTATAELQLAPGSVEEAEILKIKRGDAAGIEALTQLFIKSLDP